MPFSLFLALRYLRPSRSFVSVVTVISVVGVLLGVAILVIVLSVMTGFDDMWREKILSFKPHLTVHSRFGQIDDEEGLARRIERVPGVKAVSGAAETRVLMQARGCTAAPVVIGLSPERAAGISKVSATNYTSIGVFDVEGNKVVVGRDMALAMGLHVGDKALLYSALNAVSRDEMYLPEEVVIAGIFDMGMRDFDSGFIIGSLDLARELTGLKKGAHSMYVMTDDPFLFDRYAVSLEAALGDGYEVRTWKEIDTLLFNALSNEKTMMFVLLVFITIVAIFCVTNTLIVISVQKTGEIGLLKALGFPRGRIMAAFVLHGWIQCLAGTVLGIASGLLVLHNLKAIVRGLSMIRIDVFPKAIYGLDEIPWKASGAEILQVALVVMAFCTIASFLPARRAARLDPVEALRNE
jgi:lipoprotein-releasing system permease protein